MAELWCSGPLGLYFAIRQHSFRVAGLSARATFVPQGRTGSFAVGNSMIARDYNLFGFLFFICIFLTLIYFERDRDNMSEGG